MGKAQSVICQVRYKLDLSKLNDFETYSHSWIRLVERYGGTHEGYFLSRETPNGVATSFPGVGHDGPTDVAIAMFSFPDEASYLRYRELAAVDPECRQAEALYRESRCFLSYERLFLRPLKVMD